MSTTTTPEQDAAIERIAIRLDCWPDDFVILDASFELPQGWVTIIWGERKGKIQMYGMDPEGRAHS